MASNGHSATLNLKGGFQAGRKDCKRLLRGQSPVRNKSRTWRLAKEVIPHPGHFIHEDRPDEVAEAGAWALRMLALPGSALCRLEMGMSCNTPPTVHKGQMPIVFGFGEG